MVTVGMNYHIIKGKEEPFEKMFGKVLEVMGQMDGHAETHLYRDVANPQSYLIIPSGPAARRMTGLSDRTSSRG